MVSPLSPNDSMEVILPELTEPNAVNVGVEASGLFE